MFFRQLFEPLTSTYTYILGASSGHDAVVIDSVVDSVEVILHILDKEGLLLTHILDTHVHADHITGASLLRTRTGAQVVMSRNAGAPCADRLVDDGDIILLGDSVIRILVTPGHTEGCVSYRWHDRVFTGDALLIGGCGRSDFQGGDAATLYHSITQKLFTLPEDTQVYPAHDYHHRQISCIGEEKQTNPRLAGKSSQEFIAIMDDLKLPPPRFIEQAVPANQRCGSAVPMPGYVS